MKQTIGRFAPTPSGPLHMGSLVTAIASYCQTRSVNGKWLVRIEDLDTPRVVKGATDTILHTLESFGFEWDGAVLYQSQRFDIYEDFLQHLIQKKLIYACDCSRKFLHKNIQRTGSLGIIYPGNCRHKHLNMNALKLRLNMEQAKTTKFNDRHYGTIKQNIDHQVGDFIIKRQDGIYAYHLAVVIDDAFQQINEIVRGADLLEATSIHLHLNDLFNFTTANYLHIPLVKKSTGEKLSKQTGAEGLQINNAHSQLIDCLKILGQKIDPKLFYAKPKEILESAIQNWDAEKIPKQ